MELGQGDTKKICGKVETTNINNSFKAFNWKHKELEKDFWEGTGFFAGVILKNVRM